MTLWKTVYFQLNLTYMEMTLTSGVEAIITTLFKANFNHSPFRKMAEENRFLFFPKKSLY